MTDYVADAYKQVRDLTINNDNLTNAEALGILQLVSHEMLEDMITDVRRSAMNGE